MTGAGPVERFQRVQPLLPCEGCAHATICAIRPQVEAMQFVVPVGPDPAVSITAKYVVVCAHRASAARRSVGGKIASAWTPERRQQAADRMRTYNIARAVAEKP